VERSTVVELSDGGSAGADDGDPEVGVDPDGAVVSPDGVSVSVPAVVPPEASVAVPAGADCPPEDSVEVDSSVSVEDVGSSVSVDVDSVTDTEYVSTPISSCSP
jgi:hypothetical protein